MAEPLLKRTFSRLRGKDRSRRKTDPKLNDLQGKSDVIQSSSSSSSSSTPAMVSPPPSAEDSPPPRTQITVAKKQQWAKQACSSRDPHAQACHSLAYRSQDWESSSGKAQASSQAWSQRTLTEEGLERRQANSGSEQAFSSGPCESPSITTGLPELSTPLGGIPELCVTSSNVKHSGQGAYLQSLDRSSRAWVLSTGKAQASEEARWLLPSSCVTEGRQQGLEGEKNIWYNPIPEEEDAGGVGAGRTDREKDRENPWRRRGEAEEGSGSVLDPQTRAQRRAGLVVTADISGGAACLERQSPPGGASPGSAHRSTDITIENPDLLQCEPMVSASSDSPASQKKGGGTSESPGSQKRGGGASSMIDRIKSPGTVRKLSMKMKKLPELRRKLSLRSSRSARQNASGSSPSGDGEGSAHSPSGGRKEASSNVISRYHLDTSAPARPHRRSSRGRHASKGGYLSDGDSPELLPRQASSSAPQGGGGGGGAGTGQEGGLREVSGFTLYSGSEQPRCVHRVSGLLTVHLLGLEELLRSPVTPGPGSTAPGPGSTTPPSLNPGPTDPATGSAAPCRPEASKEVFCAIQVDGVTRARTSLLTCRGPALPLNHTFHLELEKAKLLRLVVLSPHTPSHTPGTNQNQTQTRNRVCGLGAISIPPLFKASRSQQLCVRLEPRGLLYVKLTLQEQWDPPSPRPSDQQPPAVFGLELRHLVEKESTAVPVPLLIQKCVAEIENRGLKGVGLYRLCGSAAVKKELRDAFERDSAAVTLNEDLYPDVNVITGILKDYLRELPSPLITRTLYEVVLEAMSLRPSRAVDPQLSQSTVVLLQCLPEPERATLSVLLDHLSLVASYSHSNRMTHQNLAVCFGPVLLTPTQEAWRPRPPGGSGASAGRGGRSFAHSEEIASAVDFKRHIEALHYLLQLWPVPRDRDTDDPQPPPSPPSPVTQNPLQRRCQRLPLRLEMPQDVVVSRRGRGRLESPPCNRYAGDWSVCGRDFLSGGEADYDEVAGSESDPEEEEEEEEEVEKKEEGWPSYVDDFALDFDAPFSCRLSLKDFDTLISDLERELSKQINICL